jgi:hypothetical protein
MDEKNLAFEELMKEWNQWELTVAYCSMPMERSSPVWPKTIAMGMAIVSLLLVELQQRPRWWMFSVLHEITQENPCHERHRGSKSKLTEDWLRWGKEKGYLPAR